MTTDDSNDLDGTSCAVDPCFGATHSLGVATVGIPPEIGAVEEDLTLTIPLCGYHAHLLRSGVTSFNVDSRE